MYKLLTMTIMLHLMLKRIFNCDIVIREEDGYINIGKICASHGKNFQHWVENNQTKSMLTELSSRYDDVQWIETSRSKNRHGTYVHPIIALHVAQWISPQTTVNMLGWMFELVLTGTVDVSTRETMKELYEWHTDVLELSKLSSKLDEMFTNKRLVQQEYDQLQKKCNQLFNKREIKYT